MRLTIRGADGVTRPIEATAFPLLAHTERAGRGDRDLLGARGGGVVRLRVWGCRGSIATPGLETARYGGNTSCIEVRLDDGTLIVLDAGTGARGLGLALTEEPLERIDLLLTHLHVDHVEGLGAFEPIWRPETDLHIWGPPSPVVSLADRLATYFSPPLFPLHLSEVPARTTFHDAPDGAWTDRRRDDPVRPDPASRRDGRLSDRGRRQDARVPHRPRAGARRRARKMPAGVDLRVRARVRRRRADPRLPVHAGGVRGPVRVRPLEHGPRRPFRREGGLDRLVLFHHDPMHDDAELDAIRASVLDRWEVDPERCQIADRGRGVRRLTDGRMRDAARVGFDDASRDADSRKRRDHRDPRRRHDVPARRGVRWEGRSSPRRIEVPCREVPGRVHRGLVALPRPLLPGPDADASDLDRHGRRPDRLRLRTMARRRRKAAGRTRGARGHAGRHRRRHPHPHPLGPHGVEHDAVVEWMGPTVPECSVPPP